MSTTSNDEQEIQPKHVFLERLIQDHQADVWRYLRSLGCQTHEADDLAQETFLKVFNRPFRYCGPSAAASYLRKVAYHQYLGVRRRRQPLLLSADVVEYAEHDAAAEATDGHLHDLLDLLAECLARLPERSRRSLEMRFRDQSSRKDIASALSISEHGARNLMQRAKQRLRQSIQQRIATDWPHHAPRAISENRVSLSTLGSAVA